MNEIKERISKVRTSNYHCAECNKEIPHGSYCLFTKWTYWKFCIECALNKLGKDIEFNKQAIVQRKSLVKKIIKNKDKWEKHNMACALCK